jgi:pyridoxal phosphate enzyme (YggS family)
MTPFFLPKDLANKRLDLVREEIKQAAQGVGRKENEITLLAVSKTFPAQDIKTFLDLGQRDFGENYLQEALDKIAAVEAAPAAAAWHFIGHLQTNKARFIPGNFSVLHTLDSLDLAAKLHSKLVPQNLTLKVFIQVNISGEESKSGLNPLDLPAFLDKLSFFPSLIPQGLMTMPPYDPDPEVSRPYFRQLYELREKQAPSLKGLSMGMSGDYIVAISEGATIVRVGTALFGDRD